jgi:thioredoxin-related protein
MKNLLILTLVVLATAAFAEPPTPGTELRKTLSAAAEQQKLAFVLLGRPTCGNCNATKAMIKEGKIPVTAADYVMADLNIDDQKTQGEFMRKYGKEKFGDTLPFIVVTDSHGKALASSGGYKNAEQWTALLASARSKVSAAPAAPGAPTGNSAPAGAWPFKTTAPK